MHNSPFPQIGDTVWHHDALAKVIEVDEPGDWVTFENGECASWWNCCCPLESSETLG